MGTRVDAGRYRVQRFSGKRAFINALDGSAFQRAFTR
jgi:hypothetical protein